MRHEQTIEYRVYYNGSDFLGVASIEMPQVQFMTETLSGSGIAGEFESPTIGMTQSMTMKLTFQNVDRNVFNSLSAGISALFECYGSEQVVDETNGVRTSVPRVIRVNGHLKNFNLGKWERSKADGVELEIEVLRVEVENNGVQQLLIDKLNFIYKVNGEDYLKDTRSHIGLAY